MGFSQKEVFVEIAGALQRASIIIGFALISSPASPGRSPARTIPDASLAAASARLSDDQLRGEALVVTAEFGLRTAETAASAIARIGCPSNRERRPAILVTQSCRRTRRPGRYRPEQRKPASRNRFECAGRSSSEAAKIAFWPSRPAQELHCRFAAAVPAEAGRTTGPGGRSSDSGRRRSSLAREARGPAARQSRDQRDRLVA